MLSKKVVYLVLSPSARQMKSGVSTNPPCRIKEMQTARPDIELLVTIPGGHKLERQLHQRFRKFHIAGEWFRYANEIQSFVNEVRYKRPETPQLVSGSYIYRIRAPKFKPYKVRICGRIYWQVNLGSQIVERDGHRIRIRSRRTFSRGEEAKNFAKLERNERKTHGGLGSMPLRLRVDAIQADEYLRPFGTTLVRLLVSL
jgi:hypothetical protein